MDRKSWNKQKWQTSIIFLVLIACTYASVVITDFSMLQSLQAFPEAIAWMFTNLFITGETMEKLPAVVKTLADTVLMSIAATTTGAVVALLLSLMGSRVTTVHQALLGFSRFVASVARNVPIAAWALILLLSFGQNSFTGYLALFVGSVGFLTRAFIETIDEASNQAVEALQATGATYFHVIAKAVIPQCLPQLISWILFMIETNIRSATLVGILTGTGIGYTFDIYYKSMHYDIVALATFSIVLTVILIEMASNYIRKVIL